MNDEIRETLREISAEVSAPYDASVTRRIVKEQRFLRQFRTECLKPGDYRPYFCATEQEINDNVLHRNPVPECIFHPSGMIILRVYDVFAIDGHGRQIGRMSANKHDRRRIVDWLESLRKFEMVHALVLRQICYAVPVEPLYGSQPRQELYWLGSTATVYASPPQWLRHLVNRVAKDVHGEARILTMQELKRGVERQDEYFVQARENLRNNAKAFLDGVWPRLQAYTEGKRVWCGMISGEERFHLRAERPRRSRDDANRRSHLVITLRARGQHVSFDICTNPDDQPAEIALDDIHASLDFVDFIVSVFADEFIGLAEVRAQA